MMKIFKSFTFTWWQLSLFKLSMVAFGVIVGATWPEVFAGWRVVLLGLFVVPASFITYLWFKQL